ncbi:hypothetical protein [Runella rosea]|uniref:hypothetical protein n=1 Tax=Runella rosea TaxID=2259595 RepID=UPI00196298B4|nr:hypothetical protein [Runella rosea]
MKIPDQTPQSSPPPENECEGLPPFIKTWSQMYGIVIGTLIVLIVLFYAMMHYFD